LIQWPFSISIRKDTFGQLDATLDDLRDLTEFKGVAMAVPRGDTK